LKNFKKFQKKLRWGCVPQPLNLCLQGVKLALTVDLAMAGEEKAETTGKLATGSKGQRRERRGHRQRGELTIGER
jgi:hypothetical protein